ncbi:hypothetical protein KQ693_05875 [Thermus sp. PS18]|uniref:hypothetical protein n=1 Tax=Thermus sp. PS18 TaxID=2849039 RepID=UPI0022646417|nr:hypothetical protein [Thermus sp. PS18]UZX16557.1 hypothetical protein KQ693_05875 [Thermus sp. PS18]
MPKEKEKEATVLVRPYEEWALELGTPPWLVAAVAAKERWPEGQPVSREAFERAVKTAMKEVIR